MITYRDVKATDFEGLVTNFYSYFDELKENPDLGLVLYRQKPTIAQELEWFSHLFRNIEHGDAVATVAEENSRPVGMCEVNRLRPGTDISHRGILGIVVRKEYRGKGVGTRLVEETLKKCRGKFEIVKLSVFSINRAKRLYERFGFRVYGHFPQAIKRGDQYFDEDVMYLRV
ncbi:MAG TPA: GNAT family N-acetyltransferase [Nitrososphaerales archaeon]|nr:GNAT family N-acetyltransferase [Nitrososphaerales archaeon]